LVVNAGRTKLNLRRVCNESFVKQLHRLQTLVGYMLRVQQSTKLGRTTGAFRGKVAGYHWVKSGRSQYPIQSWYAHWKKQASAIVTRHGVPSCRPRSILVTSIAFLWVFSVACVPTHTPCDWIYMYSPGRGRPRLQMRSRVPKSRILNFFSVFSSFHQLNVSGSFWNHQKRIPREILRWHMSGEVRKTFFEAKIIKYWDFPAKFPPKPLYFPKGLQWIFPGTTQYFRDGQKH